MTFAPLSSLSFPIIVHCHLRWDFVWQRPQQFLSRLSRRHRVLFVEGPTLHDDETAPYSTLTQAPHYPNVIIMKTHFPASRFGDGAWVDSERRRLVEEALQNSLKGKFERPVQWFYDPMAVLPHMGQHGSIATVYDCMDELSQFKFAPPALIEREKQLLAAADVVFAGGRKMWQSKSKQNPNTHFYGCGVDVTHFGKARLSNTRIPEDIRHLKGPILGYFGVVDERMDYDLIAKLAKARPDWHLVMVGPTAKVDPKDFPQAENIHWMGGRDYSVLPQYTRAFDVALMPFALNEATEYINPTKALEYMATATPIVSTAVSDVVSNFSTVVKISENSDDFVRLCQEQIAQIDQVAVVRGLKMANENTWDVIVGKLEKHVEDAIARRALRSHIHSHNPKVTQVAASAA